MKLSKLGLPSSNYRFLKLELSNVNIAELRI